jgi:predicted nucleic acid-binding protein
MKNICADAGFFIGLYDSRDPYHQEATTHFTHLFDREGNRLLIPWPVLYETLRTKMARNRKALLLLERDWKRLLTQQRLDLLPDEQFREAAITECFDELRKPPYHYRAVSMVDRVIRGMLADANLRIDAFITFNPEDFADVCGKFGRDLYQ